MATALLIYIGLYIVSVILMILGSSEKNKVTVNDLLNAFFFSIMLCGIWFFFIMLAIKIGMNWHKIGNKVIWENNKIR